MITEEAALKRLAVEAKVQTQAGLAGKLGISAAYLNDVLHGRRDPAHVLERFGLRRVIRYEEAT